MIEKRAQHGFTLIELSIVIVIIGFLVAGITVGSNMIKQAQIRAVITDMQQYQTAYNNFASRFSQVPGDMRNAAVFWPSIDSNDPKSCASVATNCNGDGDALIKWAGDISDETFKAWKHLSLAEMISAGIIQIPGSYTGALTIGDKAPNGRLPSSGFFMAGAGSGGTGGTIIGTGTASPWTDNRTNAVFLGKETGTTSLLNGALTPEDAFNIDQKIDDGIIDTAGNFKGALTGNIRVVTALNASSGDCYNTTTLNYNISAGGVLNNKAETCVIGAALN